MVTFRSANRRKYKNGSNTILDRERVLGIENIFILNSDRALDIGKGDIWYLKKVKT